MADDAADIATILDHLGLDEFVTLGWSGGGPRSLACAAMLPGPLPRRGLRASAWCLRTEYDGDFPAGMGEENIEEFDAPRGRTAGADGAGSRSTPRALHRDAADEVATRSGRSPRRSTGPP